MTEEEEFEAVQHEAEAAAEEALHTSKRTVDTPARNTRARRRIPALPPPVAQGQIFLKFRFTCADHEWRACMCTRICTTS